MRVLVKNRATRVVEGSRVSRGADENPAGEAFDLRLFEV